MSSHRLAICRYFAHLKEGGGVWYRLHNTGSILPVNTTFYYLYRNQTLWHLYSQHYAETELSLACFEMQNTIEENIKNK